jgi:hypothetical protein
LLAEVNIGLLGAVAIVASLLSAVLQTKFHKRWAAYSVVGFGGSGILSTIVLFDTVRTSLFASQDSLFYQEVLTYLSLFAFLISTEILVYIAFATFWKEGKVSRR